MAGGDGSQALVAAIAAEHDLPYACIPSGTRNHFALDLGVDRDDVVGALDAFVDGGERYVDLGRSTAASSSTTSRSASTPRRSARSEYRESKLRTLLETLTDTLGPEGEANELRWVDSDGADQSSTALVLVSNNAYLLGPTLARARARASTPESSALSTFHPPIAGEEPNAARWRELSAPELEVESDGPIPLGVDGEAMVLEPPLRFRIRPKALRVRIARSHPGASPSADVPRGPISALRELIRICLDQ